MGNGKVFLEIGTCDFDTCLPLAEAGWSGYMIEADPRYAEIMANKTAQYDVKVDNMAVSNKNGIVAFNQSIQTDDWARGIGVVDDADHLGARLLDLPANAHFLMDKIEVPCCRLDTYLLANEIDHIDFMKIDVEGHELNILGVYSWKVKPTFVKIEHAHIDAELIINILHKQGYMTWVESEDIYGVI